jgi:hypothetical protein
MNCSMRLMLMAMVPMLSIAMVAVADDSTTRVATTQPGATQSAATRPVGKLPHIVVDVGSKEVRVDCFTVAANYPLEFLLVVSNANEYEAIVRTDAKGSDLHLALLILGLKPGEPAHFSKDGSALLPPSGPLVDIFFEYQKEGKMMRVPAYQWLLDVHTKKACTNFVWCFTGSQFLENGVYGANMTGQLIGVVNNDLTVLDVPAIKSRHTENREWVANTDAMPPADTPVTMILTPAVQEVRGDSWAVTRP